jgi:diguanylate cyclase
MSFKLRAQVIIALIVIAVSSALTFFHISNENRYAKERSHHATANVKMAFNSIISDTEHFYTYRAYTVLRLNGVIDAIKHNETQTLYSLVLPRYTQLREENPHLIVMQFHARDGRSILRMHLKEKYGDDIASRRPMLQEVHKTHKMVTGFEGGIQGMAYRMVIPVFDGEVYVGALEFGIDSLYFVEKIKQLTGSNSILMVHGDYLGAADRSRYHEGIGAYKYTSITSEQKTYMQLYQDANPQMEPKNIHIGDEFLDINPLYLDDSQGHKVGMILCIDDLTGRYQNLSETIVGSVVLTVGLLVIFYAIFEYTFSVLFRKLTLQEQYIKMILDGQKNIVVVMDGDRIVYANAAFNHYFEYDGLESFNLEYGCICDIFESSESDEYLQPKVEGVRWVDYLMQHPTKEHKVKMRGSIFTVHANKMEYEDKIRHVVVFTDVTKLHQLATQDVLTKVANRFQFDKVLLHSISVAQRYGRALSMLLIDIDHFKVINDRYGHLAGDEVLKQVAAFLSNGVRKSDVVARWGGEEFVILLPDSELASAVKLAETLCEKIAQSSFDPVERVTCSIGVVRWNEGESADQLLKRVDEKLYRAKEGGRNRVVS